jgi:hypothetical protein
MVYMAIFVAALMDEDVMGKKNRKAPQFQTNMNIILKNKKTFESF